MPVNNSTNQRLKAVVSVSEMARLIGLSRARFYDLVWDGVFLPPIYSLRTRRPYYTTRMQEQNLAVRQSNIGVDGEYVMFYEQSAESSSRTTTRRLGHRRSTSSTSGHMDDLCRRLITLGLTTTTEQVQRAVLECYPNGTDSEDESEVLRTVYRHLRCQGTD